MATTNENWSDRLTQGYLALRAGSNAEAAQLFASVAMKAPPEVARVARLEMRARFLDKALSPVSDEHAMVFDEVLDKAFAGLSSEGRDLVRQASRSVLQELEQEGRVVVFGPLFMTRYAFAQKRVRLTGVLNESEKGVMEWGRALDYIVGGGKGSLVGRAEWRKASRLLRESGVLTCTSSRVQIASRLSPLDLIHEWISLTGRALRRNDTLMVATGTKGVLDASTYEAAGADKRFRLVGEFIWLESLASALEQKWSKALESPRGCIDVRRWCAENVTANPDSHAPSSMIAFSRQIEAHLTGMALGLGFEKLGRSILGRRLTFMDSVSQYINRLKKADLDLAELKDGLGLRGALLDGRVLWGIVRLLCDAGFVRLGGTFVHAGRTAAAVRSLLESGIREPVSWQDVSGHLSRALKLHLTREDLMSVLKLDPSLALSPDGLYARARRASTAEVRQAALLAMGEQGFTSDAALVARLHEGGRILTPAEIPEFLGDDRLFAQVDGGWALAPEFDWLALYRSSLSESLPEAWAKGVIGWTHASTAESLTSQLQVEKNRGQNASFARSARFFITGGDLVNSRLRLSLRLSRVFPSGRFVAFFRAPSGASVLARGDTRAGLVQFPLGFLNSLDVMHGDELLITRNDGWPACYDLSTTGNYDSLMRERGAKIAARFARIAQEPLEDLASAVEAVLTEADAPMNVPEIHDALRLAGLTYEPRAIAAHLASYSYFVRDQRGFFALALEKRRQYLLKISELESHVRLLKDEAKQAETMILAFRGENARLKNENREMRNRLSGLEMERLRSSEALQNAKRAIEQLNAQAKTLAKQNSEVTQKMSLAEAKVEELSQDNRRLRRELEKPLWRKMVDAVTRVFRPAQDKGLSV